MGAAREGLRVTDSYVEGAPAPLGFGIILADSWGGIIQGNRARNIVGYAHELKNDARYNISSGLIAEGSDLAYAHGQQTPDIDGADFNVLTGLPHAAMTAA